MILKQGTVSPSGEGERVDRLIQKYFPELPERSVRAAVLRKDVKLDGKRVTRETRARAGQEIRIYLREDEVESEPLRVVYEDADVLLVNKPAGISVEPDGKGGVTLTDLCARYLRKKENGGAEQDAGTLAPEGSDSPQHGAETPCRRKTSGLEMDNGMPIREALLRGADAEGDDTSDIPAFPAACHRLDNQTSGLCLFAKNRQAWEILGDVFRERRLEKYYECLVRGIPKPARAECGAWLVKDARAARVRVLDHPAPGAKAIATGYETLEAGPVSRLRVHLMTGRTHQIRAHLAALGHPILGDDVYGDRMWNREKKTRSLKLCAVSLRLNTRGAMPQLDGKFFQIRAPF